MKLIDEHTGLEALTSEECLQLLDRHQLGRVGVTVADRPVILPVNYVMDAGTIVFRTAPGTKFDASVRGAFVAFEIDDADPTYHTGWSVLVTGAAEEISGAPDRARAEALPLRPWAPGEKPHFIRIVPVTVTGRRIGPAT